MTRLLLDTHVLIWAASVPEKLTPLAASSIEGADQFYISTITGWEVVLLQRKGRINLAVDADLWLADVIARMGLTPLPLGLRIATTSALLPYKGKDPADRFIIATALAHGLKLVTADESIRAWEDVATIW